MSLRKHGPSWWSWDSPTWNPAPLPLHDNHLPNATSSRSRVSIGYCQRRLSLKHAAKFASPATTPVPCNPDLTIVRPDISFELRT